uniref:3-oxoacyl-[acyl-carrier-protein] synthase n=1 Tax=Hyalomma excavatum TaxID=257692 RepID=A0A131XLE8_9ACAR
MPLQTSVWRQLGRPVSDLIGRRGISGSRDKPKRVVVTGMGMVTPLGADARTSWSRLTQSHSGISRLGREYDGIPSRIAGLVPTDASQSPSPFDVYKFVSKSDLRSTSLATAYALSATKEALDDAQWHPESDADCRKTGVAIGNCMCDLEYVVDSGVALREKGYNKMSPFFVPRILTNMPSGIVSIQHKLKGPNHSVATACTTGVHAIGDAFSFIQRGYADVMVCGGTEASVSPICLAAFARMRALSTAEDPAKASRPFDKSRDGFVVAEGSSILVLEDLEHALARGANIHAEILGYGLSGDAFHITAAANDGEGAFACMESALKNACVDVREVGYVNAHATSTPIGDAAEAAAIRRVLGDNSNKVAVSATKGSTGHLLGAAGATESAFTVFAVRDGVIPPTLNLDCPDVGADLNFVAHQSTPWTTENATRRVALKNSFGFGGTNGSLVIAEYRE